MTALVLLFEGFTITLLKVYVHNSFYNFDYIVVVVGAVVAIVAVVVVNWSSPQDRRLKWICCEIFAIILILVLCLVSVTTLSTYLVFTLQQSGLPAVYSRLFTMPIRVIYRPVWR